MSPSSTFRIFTGALSPSLIAVIVLAAPVFSQSAFAGPAARPLVIENASSARYLKSDQALRTKPEMGSMIAIQLGKGSEVKWLRNEGLFAFVESKSGSKGYILNLLLSPTPVLKVDTSGGPAENLSAAQQSRMRPRTTAATMGVRGLSSDKALRQQFPPDIDALKQVEACRAPKSMVDQISSELPL